MYTPRFSGTLHDTVGLSGVGGCRGLSGLSGYCRLDSVGCRGQGSIPALLARLLEGRERVRRDGGLLLPGGLALGRHVVVHLLAELLWRDFGRE